MYFDKFTRRVDITATLRCLTALRIGAGKSTTDITSSDLPILRGADGQPLIPGSSLKGVLRSAVESILRSIPENPDEVKRWACDPFAEDQRRCVPTKDPSDTDKRERMRKQRERMKDLCRACRTFGAPSYASHVLFRDARTRERVRVERRDGVAIDRDLGGFRVNENTTSRSFRKERRLTSAFRSTVPKDGKRVSWSSRWTFCTKGLPASEVRHHGDSAAWRSRIEGFACSIKGN